jgi:hypothetical protein
MKILLALLLLTSCASTKRRVIMGEEYEPKCKQVEFMERMEICMVKFSKQGFDSDGIVKMCNEIFKRRD